MTKRQLSNHVAAIAAILYAANMGTGVGNPEMNRVQWAVGTAVDIITESEGVINTGDLMAKLGIEEEPGTKPVKR